MPANIPDCREVAKREAEQILARREELILSPLNRVLADSPFVDRQAMLDGLERFHRERMERIPSPAKYPESVPWVDYVLAVDREVQRLASLTDSEMAMYRSLGVFLRFRGFAHAATVRAADEKCRVAYVPESDHGRLHFKNVDDPATYWKPEPRPVWLFDAPGKTLWSDGVGNGLHMDDEPGELFPLPVLQMYPLHANDVPSVVEFLTRYSKFWGGANMIFHDRQKRSVAIEKCSHNYIECFPPDADGRNHISGMTCRDPNSPQGRYQRSQRQKYLTLFGQPDDCADNAFWDVCWKAEQKLSAGLTALSNPARLADLIALFTTPWPGGLNKTGQRLHPKQGLLGYTLITCGTLLDEHKLLRWQRSELPELTYPDKPEIFEF